MADGTQREAHLPIEITVRHRRTKKRFKLKHVIVVRSRINATKLLIGRDFCVKNGLHVRDGRFFLSRGGKLISERCTFNPRCQCTVDENSETYAVNNIHEVTPNSPSQNGETHSPQEWQELHEYIEHAECVTRSTSCVNYEVKLSADPSLKPFKHTPYPCNPEKRKKIQQGVTDLINSGHYKRGESRYQSRAFF